MNYLKIDPCDGGNGPGLRVTLWIAGCDHCCKGCQNPETWDINTGKLFDKDAEDKIFKELSKPYIKGLTISGGDPLYSTNPYCLFYLLSKAKERFPKKDIWMWTGYTWEEIWSEDNRVNVAPLVFVDILVDGKFEIDKRDITLEWRGSTNQRIIDVQKSIQNNKVCLWKDGQYK